MQIIALLIAISLTIAIGFLAVFIWNLKSGQYDDTYTPSIRMLFDNKTTPIKSNEKAKEDN
jgi:cbb3-type cytochrome oxidase maturation protein